MLKFSYVLLISFSIYVYVLSHSMPAGSFSVVPSANLNYLGQIVFKLNSWLCYQCNSLLFVCVCALLCRHERYVALKIVKSARHCTETAMDEIELLKRVCLLKQENFLNRFCLAKMFAWRGPMFSFRLGQCSKF